MQLLQQRHSADIELGLERVRRVAETLALTFGSTRIITVAGTNGKGSCVAMLDAALRAAGVTTATYTSPHLQHFSERITIDGVSPDDDTLCTTFEMVQAAATDVPLTWFEFTTLAILKIIADAGVQVAILEVGLGGRLDAVNIVDADVALITSIGIDHTEWLGDDRESIGREKAGIMRAGAPVVCGDPDAPASIAEFALECGARLYQRGREFDLIAGRWWGSNSAGERVESTLPAAQLAADNIAAVLQTLELVPLAFDRGVAIAALEGFSVAGRLQRLQHNGVDCVLDVAHNLESVRLLQRWLQQHPADGRTVALFAAMSDKPVGEMLAIMSPLIDSWWFCDLAETARAMPAKQVAALLQDSADILPTKIVTVAELTTRLNQELSSGDRLLVFGSFYLVGPVLAKLSAAVTAGTATEAKHA